MAAKAKKETVLTSDEKLKNALVPVDQQPYPVPGNWCWVKHNGILDISGGSQPAKSLFISEPKEGYIQLYQTRDYGERPVPVYIPIEYATKITDEGDILLARYGGSLGKVFRAHKGAYNVALAKVIKLNPEVLDDEYLFLYYQSHFYQDFCVRAASGRSAQAGFNRNDMDGLQFPLPPLPEQHRIVARIESLFAKLDEVKEKAQAVVDGYEDRKAAILHKAFTGELTAKWRKENDFSISSWELHPFGDLVSDARLGLVRGKTEQADNKCFGYLKMNNITLDGYIDLDGLARVDATPEEALVFSLSEGDFLFNTRNSFELVGKNAVWRFSNVSKMLFNNNIMRVRFCNKVSSLFVSYYLNSAKGKHELEKVKKNTTNIAAIYAKDLYKINIPIPLIYEQNQICQILDSFFEKSKKVREIAETVLDQIDAMKKAILARAFRGELGTNNPSDEPAIELLKRVLKEK